MEEFVDSYFQQQVAIDQKIEELTKLINLDTLKRAEIAAKLKEIADTESINEYGIMNNSMLTAQIIEARGVPRGRSPGYVVYLETEGQTQRT